METHQLRFLIEAKDTYKGHEVCCVGCSSFGLFQGKDLVHRHNEDGSISINQSEGFQECGVIVAKRVSGYSGNIFRLKKSRAMEVRNDK